MTQDRITTQPTDYMGQRHTKQLPHCQRPHTNPLLVLIVPGEADNTRPELTDEHGGGVFFSPGTEAVEQTCMMRGVRGAVNLGYTQYTSVCRLYLLAVQETVPVTAQSLSRPSPDEAALH